ncbi:MAG TPA: PAS domain S-box protein [Anaerolineales bacterium]|nr:PAS domain S-box protein [Anaerolineales bacterium]HNH25765.1 PAS domain S-box protein [Anaerolineales bacterium]
MLKTIKQFFTPPVFPDEDDKTRNAQILYALFASMMGILALLMLANIFVFVAKAIVSILLFILFIWILVARALAQSGKILLASRIFVSGLWILTTFQLLLSGQLSAAALAFHVSNLSIAGVLLKKRSAITLAVMSSLVGLGMVILEITGYSLHRYFPNPPIVYWITWVIAFIMTIIPLNLTVQSAGDALARAQKSERRYVTLFNKAPMMYLIIRNEGDIPIISDCNFTFLKNLGYTREQVIGQPLANFYTPQSRLMLLKEGGFQSSFQNEVTTSIERDFVAQDGHILHTLVRTASEIDESGQSIGVLAMYLDITERKQAEEALRESETKLQTIFARSRDAIGVSKSGVHIFVNPAYVFMFGYESAEELIDTPVINLIAPESREMIIHNIQDRDKGLAVPSDYETVALRKDGSTFILDVRISTYILQGEQYTLVILRDITERKRAEEALQIKEWAIRSSINALALSDLDGSLIYVNPAFLALWGYQTEQEVLGRSAIEFWQVQENADQVISALRTQGGWMGEMVATRKDGTLLDVEVVASMVADNAGKPLCMMGAFVDITDRKRAEVELTIAKEKAEENEKKLREVLDNTKVQLWAFDGTRYNYVSKEWYDFTGQTLDTPLTIDLWVSAVHPDDREPSGKIWLENWERKTAHDNYFRLRRQDGVYRDFYCHAIPIFDSQNKFKYFHGFNVDITERKQAEEKLRHAENRLELFFSQSLDGFFFMLLDEPIQWSDDIDKDKTLEHVFAHQRITKANDAMLSLFGTTRKQFIGLTPKDLYPGDVEQRKHFWGDLFDKGHLQLLTAETKSDGSIMWLEGDYVCMYDTDGRLLGHFGIVRDVTERKQAEAVTAARARILQFSLTHSLPDFLQNVLDECELLTSSSIGFFHFMEADQNTLSLQNWSTRTLGEFCTAVGKHLHYPLSQAGVWADCARERQAIICNDYAGAINSKGMPDGHAEIKRFVSIPILRGENVVAIIGIGNKAVDYDREDVEIVTQLADLSWDITERKRAEDSLWESETRFRRLANNAPDIIFRYNFTPEMKLAFINPAVEKITFYTPEECYADPLLMLNMAHPDDAMMMAEYLQSRQTPDKPLIMRWLDKYGTIHWMESRLVPIYDEADQLVAVEGITRDITERKRAELQIEEQLKRLNAMHTIDTFIKSSFDLKNTLNILLTEVATQLKVDAASILLFNKDTLTLNYSAGYGFRSIAIQHTKLRYGEGFAGRLLHDRKIIRIPDLTKTESELAKALALKGDNFTSYMGVPLIAKGQTLGVLEIFQRAELTPDTDWFDFLEMLADQAAIAIDNMQLFESLQRSNLDLTLAYDATIEGWSRALDLRDKETEGHTQRVTSLTIQLAQQMGVPDADILHIRRGALLHDIGKMGVSDNILRKPGPLTEAEWQEMRQHPLYAYKMLAPISYLNPALDIPYCHHEKWDGTGYPRGLKGEEIPLVARIFAIADVYDAITSDRPYRAAWAKEKALDFIREQSGRHFDPNVVKYFLEMIKDEVK